LLIGGSWPRRVVNPIAWRLDQWVVGETIVEVKAQARTLANAL
jgi:hypothetical protein